MSMDPDILKSIASSNTYSTAMYSKCPSCGNAISSMTPHLCPATRVPSGEIMDAIKYTQGQIEDLKGQVIHLNAIIFDLLISMRDITNGKR